jgi:soluble lytic murein transglycosylase-like protein
VPAPGGGSAQPLGTAAPATAGTGTGGGGGHLVRPGETLSGIAAANGLTTAALAGANGLSPTAFVIAGTRLRIPAAGGPTEATGTPAAVARPSGAGGGYVVRPGDTLSEVALRNRLPITQVASLNGLRPDSFLIAGTSLRLPVAGVATAAAPMPAGPAAASAPVAAGGHVSAADIHRIAGENGVPGSLAAAIAWQESGFNNAMVSSTNARGVMQVMPGTWQEVQGLAGGRLLNPASAADNVRAGTMYLGHLLRQTNGDPALAAAAYYQGLSSVRRIGMLPETRRYVANVLALRGRFGG